MSGVHTGPGYGIQLEKIEVQEKFLCEILITVEV